MRTLSLYSFLLLSIFYLVSVSESSGGTSTKNIVASQITTPPTIDGILSEDIWNIAVPVSGFQQYEPDEGNPASEASSVRILFDNDALYVGVVCDDSDPQGIVKQLSRRDRTVQADRFSVIIDSYHDHKTAFLFSGAVSGVQSDGVLSQDGTLYDVQWDAVWDFAADVGPNGWSAEFKIPFSALRFSAQDSEYVWGINFRRYIARKKETDEWVMVPRMDTPPGTVSSVSKMGTLSGIININPSLHLELLPYHVSELSYLSQPAPFSVRSEYKPNFGLDVKYGITSNYTLDLALNPDFGQVEVDKKILNLTVFETEYPEKRPFFLEGSQIFLFGNSFDNHPLPLLYSRRIGRYPTGYKSKYVFGSDVFKLDSNATYSKKPQVTTILSAAKFSGITESGLEIGALSTITNNEFAILKDITNKQSPSVLVEPRANYNAVRLKQNITDGSTTGSLGFMATGSYKQKQFPSYSGGLDWNVRINDGIYGVDGYIAGSNVKVEPQANSSGASGRLALGKLQSEHWYAFTAYDFATKNFNIDDLGFYSQPRDHGGYFQLSYKEDKADEPIWRYVLTTQAEYRWNWYGINTLKEFEFEPSFEFRNFWMLSFDYYHDLSAYDDENQGIIGLYKRPAINKIFATMQTDTRQPIIFSLNIGYLNSAKHSNTFQSVAEATIRPYSWIEFVPGFTFMKTKKEEAWIIGNYTNDSHNLFGDRDVDYYDFSLRGTITFTRNMSFQFFNQIMFAKWRYTNFKTLIAPDYLPPLADQSTPKDYFMKVLNANIVFRWEYLPGSTLFLVWTQGRQGYNGFYDQRISKDFNDVFRLPMDNVILAKISYWYSL